MKKLIQIALLGLALSTQAQTGAFFGTTTGSGYANGFGNDTLIGYKAINKNTLGYGGMLSISGPDSSVFCTHPSGYAYIYSDNAMLRVPLQVGVGTTPVNSAALEIASTSRGFLASRMTTAQRDLIAAPATGLMIYNLTTGAFNWYTGATWSAVGSGSGTVTSVSGTANRITSSGGAAPVIDISGSYTGQASITTVGALSSGSLAAGFTPVTVPLGGSGAATLTGLLQGNGAGAFTGISNSSTVGEVLRVTGASTYAWGALDLTDGDAITGALGQANGGSGTSSAWGAGVLSWILSPTATNLRSAVVGTTGDAGSALVFATSPTLVTPVLGTPASGVLTNTTGYTGANLVLTDVTTNNTSTTAHGFFPKLTSNSLYYVNNAGALTALTAGASGTVLSGNGVTSAPTWATPTSGAALSAITAAAAGNTINNTNYAQEWQWSTLGAGDGLKLSSTSTAAASNTSTLLNIVRSGANATASQTVYGQKISITNTGTTNTNVGLYIDAVTGSTAVNSLQIAATSTNWADNNKQFAIKINPYSYYGNGAAIQLGGYSFYSETAASASTIIGYNAYANNISLSANNMTQLGADNQSWMRCTSGAITFHTRINYGAGNAFPENDLQCFRISGNGNASGSGTDRLYIGNGASASNNTSSAPNSAELLIVGASGSNVAAGNFSILLPRGTGSAATAGGLIIQGTPVINGTAATSQALATVMTVTKRGDVIYGTGNHTATSNLILQGATTDAATAVELTSDGAAGSGVLNRIAVPTGAGLSVVVNISVKQTGSGDAKQMLRQFVISNNGGTTAIQGSVTILGTDVGSAGLTTVTCTITANDVNDAIKVEVNGVAATNLKYSAYIVSTQTIY